MLFSKSSLVLLWWLCYHLSRDRIVQIPAWRNRNLFLFKFSHTLPKRTFQNLYVMNSAM